MTGERKMATIYVDDQWLEWDDNWLLPDSTSVEKNINAFNNLSDALCIATAEDEIVIVNYSSQESINACGHTFKSYSTTDPIVLQLVDLTVEAGNLTLDGIVVEAESIKLDNDMSILLKNGARLQYSASWENNGKIIIDCQNITNSTKIIDSEVSSPLSCDDYGVIKSINNEDFCLIYVDGDIYATDFSVNISGENIKIIESTEAVSISNNKIIASKSLDIGDLSINSIFAVSNTHNATFSILSDTIETGEDVDPAEILYFKTGDVSLPEDYVGIEISSSKSYSFLQVSNNNPPTPEMESWQGYIWSNNVDIEIGSIPELHIKAYDNAEDTGDICIIDVNTGYQFDTTNLNGPYPDGSGYHTEFASVNTGDVSISIKNSNGYYDSWSISASNGDVFGIKVNTEAEAGTYSYNAETGNITFTADYLPSLYMWTSNGNATGMSLTGGTNNSVFLGDASARWEIDAANGSAYGLKLDKSTLTCNGSFKTQIYLDSSYTATAIEAGDIYFESMGNQEISAHAQNYAYGIWCNSLTTNSLSTIITASSKDGSENESYTQSKGIYASSRLSGDKNNDGTYGILEINKQARIVAGNTRAPREGYHCESSALECPNDVNIRVAGVLAAGNFDMGYSISGDKYGVLTSIYLAQRDRKVDDYLTSVSTGYSVLAPNQSTYVELTSTAIALGALYVGGNLYIDSEAICVGGIRTNYEDTNIVFRLNKIAQGAIITQLDSLDTVNNSLTGPNALQVENKGKLIIDVKNSNMGTYVLADNVDTFQKKISLKFGEMDSFKKLSAGVAKVYDKKEYLLNFEDGQISITISQSHGPEAKRDFNESRISDIAVFDEESRTFSVIADQKDGSFIKYQIDAPVTDASWNYLGTGYIDADNVQDVLWAHDSGEVGVWLVEGNTKVHQTIAGATSDWKFLTIADVTGDGRDNIIWQHESGTVLAWDSELNAAQKGDIVLGGVNTEEWNFAGTGDMTGDGVQDILWRHEDGLVGFWDSSNNQNWVSLGSADEHWQILETGDFDNDGIDELLWQNDSGLIGAWDYENGSVAWNSFGDSNTLAGYNFCAIGDYNGDSFEDILWCDGNDNYKVWCIENNEKKETMDITLA